MLNLNVDKHSESNPLDKSDDIAASNALESLNESAQNTWKVLVFDSLGRDIISSVLRVNDLFKNGVTVHMYVIYRF